MTMTKALLTLEIMGVEGLIYKLNEINSINVRIENGSLLGLRPGHAPLVGVVVKGYVTYKSNEIWNEAEIDAGILTVENNNVRILTTGAL
jgi:F0F1-type ATP synthase epsilon subunit